MAIEPLTNIMSVQAQSYPQIKQEQSFSFSQSELSIIQPQILERKLTTVAESDKSSFGKESKNKDENAKDNRLSRELSTEEKEKLKELLKQANRVFGNTRASFRYHEGTNRVEIKIIDRETNEVIKEIPPEEALDSIAKRIEMYEKSGLLFDKKC